MLQVAGLFFLFSSKLFNLDFVFVRLLWGPMSKVIRSPQPSIHEIVSDEILPYGCQSGCGE